MKSHVEFRCLGGFTVIVVVVVAGVVCLWEKM